MPENQIEQFRLEIDENENNYETIFIDYLKNSPHIRIIFIPNSRAYRIANILKKYKIAGLMLIGFDTLNNNIKLLKEGYIQFLIAQQSQNQSYHSVISLFNALFIKNDVKREHYFPVDILNKENIDFYVGRMW